MKKILLLAFILILIFSVPAEAAEEVTIVYQNDLHGWLSPSSTLAGIDRVARIIKPIF